MADTLDTLDTPQTKKMQRERGREARKDRWADKDTRIHTRELYRDPSDQQWQDYAEQEAAYRKMAQDAAKAALAPETPAEKAEPETPPKKAASSGGGGAKKQPQPKYTEKVDTELPVGVIAPDAIVPYEEPEARQAVSSALVETFPDNPSALRLAEIYDEWASGTSVISLTKAQRLGLPGADGQYLNTGVPYYALARDADPKKTERAWHAAKLLLRKIEQDYELEPGQALAVLPKAQQLALENIKYAAELAQRAPTGLGRHPSVHGVDYSERDRRAEQWLKSYVDKGRTPAEREKLRAEGQAILEDAKRQGELE
tara:strand:+ start:1611 stop:2552 length:942 start_codon:yes stop_codon:yes gene_type:complete